MSTTELHVGISTCPNDTFAFHGLLSERISARAFGLEMRFELLDVQTLNERWRRGEFDVAKISFAAAFGASDESVVLPVGAALGRGVGPVVLAAPNTAIPAEPDVLAPGEHTTAALLWRVLHPGRGRLRHVVFSEIMPALARGEADLGLCIHEGRFTFEQHGLRLVEDLGATWERTTGLPLPLGGLVARTRLGVDTSKRCTAAIRASLDEARAHPDQALATMRRWAQEQTDEVLWKHVELYVTDQTRSLDAEGRRALAVLAEHARKACAAAPGRDLTVLADAEAARPV